MPGGAEFRDYGPLYAVYIPDNWIYQAKESTPLLNVFYGAGEYDLLYFELLENVCDRSAGDFGRRALQLYAAAGGLRQFELLEPLSPVEVGGLDGGLNVHIFIKMPRALSCGKNGCFSFCRAGGAFLWPWRGLRPR